MQRNIMVRFELYPIERYKGWIKKMQRRIGSSACAGRVVQTVILTSLETIDLTQTLTASQ